MPRRAPFKHHRFPKHIILCAVRWYLRYPLSYQKVVDLLAERGVTVDRSTVYRWVQKFGPELTKRTERHLCRASVDWHVDETCIRVGGNTLFHRRLFEGTQNPSLVDAIEQSNSRTHGIRSHGLGVPALLEQAETEHLKMVSLIEAGDLDGLAKACVSHMTAARSFYEEKYCAPFSA